MEENDTKADSLVALSEGLADTVEKIGPSVVRVKGGRRWPASGLVFGEGLVLTTSHAVEREEDLSVETEDGRTLTAELVGRDDRNNLALLAVGGLGAAEVATPASATTRVGQLVLAVGRPGKGPRVSFGVVSALGSASSARRRGRGRTPERYVQTDASAYRGLGGGPLVDAAGDVVGVVIAAFGGATLAVPAEVAWASAESIREGGSVRRGYLGVYSQPVRLPGGRDAGLTQEGGLLVVGVGDGSPAAHAGLIVGDIIATVDGQPVEDTDDLLVVLEGDRAGKTVPVQVLRGGEPRRFDVSVGERG